MKKIDIIMVVFVIVIIISSILVTNYKTQELGIELVPTSVSKDIRMIRESQVEKINIFCSMANIENYPIILSEYGFSVKMINQTDNVVFAEEKVEYLWMTTKAIVKHTFFPYNSHVIEIMDGDAEGSKIEITFEKIESGTKLKSKVHVEFKGLLLGFGLIPQANFKHAINTVFTPFEKDAMNKDYSC